MSREVNFRLGFTGTGTNPVYPSAATGILRGFAYANNPYNGGGGWLYNSFTFPLMFNPRTQWMIAYYGQRANGTLAAPVTNIVGMSSLRALYSVGNLLSNKPTDSWGLGWTYLPTGTYQIIARTIRTGFAHLQYASLLGGSSYLNPPGTSLQWYPMLYYSGDTLVVHHVDWGYPDTEFVTNIPMLDFGRYKFTLGRSVVGGDSDALTYLLVRRCQDDYVMVQLQQTLIQARGTQTCSGYGALFNYNY